MLFYSGKGMAVHRIAFTVSVYNGEDFETATDKIGHSLRRLPLQVYDFSLVARKRVGDWGQNVEATVDISLQPGVTLEDVLKKFDNIHHLQKRTILTPEPISE